MRPHPEADRRPIEVLQRELVDLENRKRHTLEALQRYLAAQVGIYAPRVPLPEAL
jgi:hypothetical protein